jgi:hypothetical protein
MILYCQDRRRPKDPGFNYTLAVCDHCEVVCPGSRLPGRVGFTATRDARRIALEAGWVERDVEKRASGRRDSVLVTLLLCPKCQGVA